MKVWLMIGLFLAGIFVSCKDSGEKHIQLKVLQLNIWQDATQVDGAYDAVVNEIAALQPDVVTFCEVRNYEGVMFTEKLCVSLKEKGLAYYTFDCLDGGIISKHPILESSILDSTTINRAIIQVDKQKIAIYAAHLDYTHYACYLPRGYDGITWKERPYPKSVDEILAQNDASKRIQQIKCLMQQAEKDIQDGCQVIVGGDFNEPSWLDWQENTQNMYDHNGFVVPWTTTKLLANNGYEDAYRVLYPNVVTHPGFTWVADNPDKKIENLTWAPKADERDRIDFIFYKGDKLRAVDAAVVGPKGSIVKNERVQEVSEDKFILPQNVWPSDHKGVWAVLEIDK